jgi:gliding motility associated protien GldN
MEKRALILVLLVLGGTFTFAQNKILDGIYIKENTPTRRVIPYTHVREADAMWMRRIWRSLDMHEKLNHTLYYPIEEINNRKSLFSVIKHAIEEGTITAYGNAAFDDEFKSALTKTEALATLTEMTNIMREDEEGNLLLDSVPEEVTSREIKLYWMKEEWFFDRERSVLDVRILGIAPVKEKLDDDGVTVRGIIPLFWIYFPEARYVFANNDVFNTFNDAERRTFEDIFWKRMFSSFITKESNVYERNISDYKTGLDALLEAEEIKSKIFNFEQDFWNY